MVEFSVVHGDIMTRRCDLLIVKHADGFHGIDGLVADRIGFREHLSKGSYALAGTGEIAARKVLFCGVGPLDEFRYGQIREFAAKSLSHAIRVVSAPRVICSPLHGPGYGLDEKEAFFSLIGGFLDTVERCDAPPIVTKIEIVEINEARAERLSKLLDELLNRSRLWSASPDRDDHGPLPSEDEIHRELASFGAESERKPKLFVAMPFADEFSDIWEVAIQDASASAGVVSERLAEQAYVGDIVSQIKKRISAASGLLAVLDGSSPNVFLELGYAWALGKPTVLIARNGNKLPFDVQGQKCIAYTNIGGLRRQLSEELSSLKQEGAFLSA
jgi:hypothetical protein